MSRRFQFSLGRLLAAVALLSVSLALFVAAGGSRAPPAAIGLLGYTCAGAGLGCVFRRCIEGLLAGVAGYAAAVSHL